MRKKRILFIVNVDWFFCSHRLPIAKRAIDEGYEVHLATSVTDRQEMLRQLGIVVHPLRMRRGSTNPIELLHSLIQIANVYRKVRPDLAHLVTIKPVLLGGLAARLVRVPALVVAISGLGSVFVAEGTIARLRRWLVGGVYRAALRHRKLALILQNRSDEEILLKMSRVDRRLSTIIPGSGVDLQTYACRPPPAPPPVVMLAGRLLRDKGVVEFIEAAQICAGKAGAVGKARFVLVGAPDPDNPGTVSQRQIDDWVARGVIEHWGPKNAMAETIASVHLVVLPSYYGEGLPKILIEAAACCRSVITTDHPGCRDAIKPGVTGLLVPPRDPAALAEAIDMLLRDPARCRRMGIAGRERAERLFDIETVVDKHLSIYRGLLDEKTSGRDSQDQGF